MLPLSALVGVSAAGYLLDKAFKNNNENYENNTINGHAENYPWDLIDNFSDIKEQKNTKYNSNIPINKLQVMNFQIN